MPSGCRLAFGEATCNCKACTSAMPLCTLLLHPFPVLLTPSVSPVYVDKHACTWLLRFAANMHCIECKQKIRVYIVRFQMTMGILKTCYKEHLGLQILLEEYAGFSGDVGINPDLGQYRLSGQVAGVEVNELRKTLGVRPTPYSIGGAVRGVLHVTGALDQPVFSGAHFAAASLQPPRYNILHAYSCTAPTCLPRLLAHPPTHLLTHSSAHTLTHSSHTHSSTRPLAPLLACLLSPFVNNPLTGYPVHSLTLRWMTCFSICPSALPCHLSLSLQELLWQLPLQEIC